MAKWNVHFNMTVRTGDPKLITMVAKIHALSSVIHGIPIPPHLQERLDRLNIARAVRGTTGIEGTEVSEEEVQDILEANQDKPVLSSSRIREEKEVRNASDLMFYVAELLESNPNMPITEELIKEFHFITTRGIDYANNVPGQYRSVPVHAGQYSPPDNAQDISTLMREFLQWFNTGLPKSWDPVIRAIAAHFFIVSIHTFGDGNGRMSRAVESYLLYQSEVNPRGFYSLANYYYRNRPEYIHMLNLVRFRSDPDLTPFIAFALKGLVEELEQVHAEVLSEVRVIAFRDFAREVLTTHGRLGTPVGERQMFLLYGLQDKSVSLKGLRAGRHSLSRLYRNVTNKTLMRDINFLKQHDLILLEKGSLRANLEVMTQFTAPRRNKSS